jgi:TrwC relaxase
MLTIGKLGTSRGRLEYYGSQIAAAVEDYYAGRGESPGRWRGAGSRALSLSTRGTVKRHEFMRLMAGCDPADGSVLRAMGARSTVAGFDLTFSAPKSVSVLFAIGDDQTAAELLAAHEHAVDAALAYLEREACATRRGRDGIERLRGEGFVAASYRHPMSRAGDPLFDLDPALGEMTQRRLCDNLTRERLNHAGRTRLKHNGVLAELGVHIGGREYSPGARVVARRNDRAKNLDNGSIGTVLAVDGQRFSMIVQTDTGQTLQLAHAYISDHIEHAYALTAHAAQGATVTWAAVVGRPEHFTREWAYTALSRARQQTLIHVEQAPPESQLAGLTGLRRAGPRGPSLGIRL